MLLLLLIEFFIPLFSLHTNTWWVPKEACYYIKNLLPNMNFPVIIVYDISHSFFENNANAEKTGQGKLQGSSSAAHKCKTSILIHP
jgi:hypothetical protein